MCKSGAGACGHRREGTRGRAQGDAVRRGAVARGREHTLQERHAQRWSWGTRRGCWDVRGRRAGASDGTKSEVEVNAGDLEDISLFGLVGGGEAMPAKNFRKQTIEQEDAGAESGDEEERRLKLEEVKFLQKLRERKPGISALPIVQSGAGGFHRSGDKADGDGEKEDLVLQDTFAQETAVTIEDPNMLKYVEQELAKRRGHKIDSVEKEDKDPMDELCAVPEHLKVRKRNSEESSTQWTTGIAEVQLPIEYKLRNMEETEAAKKLLQEKRLVGRTKPESSIPSSYSADYFHRDRDYAEKLRSAKAMSNEPGPDILGYFRHLVSELLVDHEAIPLPFPEYKKERLNVLLNESVDCIAEEIEKIKDQILAEFQTESELGKEQLAYHGHKADGRTQCTRKRKAPSVSTVDNGGTDIQQSTVKCLFEIQLDKMEQGLEDFLDIVVSKCRSMTRAEKERLGRRIKKLPQPALNRVVQIITQRGSSMEDPAPSEILVNLEAQDDITLWRLYYYVETVLRANNLSSCSNPMPFPLV
ncbi:Transcription factor GTE1 [Apostasia shenzhenica]|uniref:Transcription factor GTE1 n=1 Tax=Apostasia shenzhenica TaxID=1088818 RepID=A0A2I0AM60_9ASPA|nr:Transcription factor GTE1 [Apostasia shenzhenica]